MGELVDRYDHYRNSFGPPGEKWHWHLNEPKNLLISSFAKLLQKGTVTLFVDALDECGEQNAVDLVKLFKSLTGATPNLGICFTCRHYPILPFDDRLSINVDHENGTDIEIYVYSELSMIKNEFKATIPSMIINQACGVFMWARLVVAQVEQAVRSGATETEMKASIQRTPQELDSLYYTLVEGMKDKDKSLKLVQWILLRDKGAKCRRIAMGHDN